MPGNARQLQTRVGAGDRGGIMRGRTMYGESVSWTPICDNGEPIGPMEKGSTSKSAFSFWRISKG